MAAPTPLAWLLKLYGELSARQSAMSRLDAYYKGDHPLPFLTEAHDAKMRNEFRTLLEDSRSNFCRLVVDAVEERLQVEGFRLSASTNILSDADSWRLWQENAMDSESQVAILEALVKGVSYVSVWYGEEDGSASIAVEDPAQTIVGYEPGSGFRRRAAALKVWRDDWTGLERANVYLPDGIWKFERRSASDIRRTSSTGDPNRFGPLEEGGSVLVELTEAGGWVELANEFVDNPLGIVPIVPLRNRPRLLVEGESELEDVTPIQNQINGFLFLLALAGYFGAHKQRWATGIALAETKDGKPAELLSAIDTLWINENPSGSFGEFSQTDLGGYVKAIEQKVLHIAVTTRTPRHYLIEQGQSPSGDAIKSAESGLTKKVSRKMRPFGEGFEEAIRLARRFAGLGVSPVDSEIVWSDPEIRSDGEKADAASKKVALGLITREQALEDLGYTQTQIARMLSQPPPTPPALPTPPSTGDAPPA